MPRLRDRYGSDPRDREGAGREVRGHSSRQYDDHLSAARRGRTSRDRSLGTEAFAMKAMKIAARVGLALVAAALTLAALAAQPPPTTTDDLRSVPIPPQKVSDRPALLIVNA